MILIKGTEAGIDAMEFVLELSGISEGCYLEKKSLKNPFGVEYASVEIIKGKLKVYFNPSLVEEPDNVKPYTRSKMKSINRYKWDLEYDLQKLLDEYRIRCDISRSVLKRVECNKTKRVIDGCSVHQVLNFINRCCCDTKNMVFQRPCKEFKYFKEDETIYAPLKKDKGFILKCYDKTADERRKGNILVERNLLRIEIVMLSRTIRRLFGEKASLGNVLTVSGLSKVIKEYQRIFNCVFLKGYVERCQAEIVEKLVEHLIEHNSPKKTAYFFKEVILDEVLYRRALKRWYEIKGSKQDYSRNRLNDYREMNFPKNVLKAINDFQ